MEYFNPLASAFWVNIGVAILCGAIIGLERQLRGKPLGVRTSCLICLSTSVFVHLGSGITSTGVNQMADPTRVIGQIVTGVGFLGAGVILTRGQHVLGVTTAAVIWMLAAIGAAIGTGNHLGAIALSVVTLGILTGVEFLESGLRLLRGEHAMDQSGKKNDS